MTPETNQDDFVSLDDFALHPAKPDRARGLAIAALIVAGLAALLGLGGLLVGGLLNPTPTPLAIDVAALQEQVDEARATLTVFTTPTPAELEARLFDLEATLQAIQLEITKLSPEITLELGALSSFAGATPPPPPALANEPPLVNELTEEIFPTVTPAETSEASALAHSDIIAQVIFNVRFSPQIFPRGCGIGNATHQVTDSANINPVEVTILGQDGECWLIKWSGLEGDAITTTAATPSPSSEGLGYIRKGLVKLSRGTAHSGEVAQEPVAATSAARTEQAALSKILATSLPKVTLAPTITLNP